MGQQRVAGTHAALNGIILVGPQPNGRGRHKPHDRRCEARTALPGLEEIRSGHCRVKPSTVILHSRADDVVPFAHSEELVKNSRRPASALIRQARPKRLAFFVARIRTLKGFSTSNKMTQTAIRTEITMSIGKQVADAIDKMQANDPEGALHALCSAIDATATKEYGKRGKGSFKDFIGSNFGLITGVAFGPKILNIRLGFVHPDLKSTDGTHPIQDIFYVAVRCNLYHETALPPNITFVKEEVIQTTDKGAIILCEKLICNGLMTAVVVSPRESC